MDKTQKKKRRQVITWISLVALVALLAAMPLIAGSGVEPDGPVATIKTGTVDTGTIVMGLGGGGTLSGETAEKLTLPAGIKLKEYLVPEGSRVAEGDPLAVVDRISVMLAISEIQETMDYLADQIEDAEVSGGAERILSQTAARVKQVFAQPGDDVQDVMLAHGALAVLSLDGRMAVAIERETDYSAGDSVTVVFADETEITGRVESALGSDLVVTIADNGYAVGEKVALRSLEGEALGTGELSVHNAWKATAYFGTVDQVNIKENDKVSAGKVLFRLENTGHSTQIQLLNAERQEYEELLEKLFGIYESGYLTAPCDGYVYGVDEDSTWLLAAGEQGWKVDLLTHVTPVEQTDWTIVRLSETDAPEDTPPEEGEEPAPAKTWHVLSAVQVVSQTSDTEWSVRQKSIDAVVTDLSVLNVSIPQTAPVSTMTFGAVFGLDGQPHTIQAGDILLKVEEGGSTYWLYLSNAGGFGGFEGFGGFGSFGGFNFGGTGQQETFEKFDLTEETVLTVTPDKTMTLDITIDELDISRISIGQEATITIPAVGGEPVSGIVTEIGDAVNSGGNSKFTVTITMDRTGKMLAGMSVSAEMELTRTENVLRIPVAALNDSGSGCFVYTGWSEKDGTLTNPVSVVTGISDGEYVQILSGLEQGDTFFYSWYDAQESSEL